MPPSPTSPLVASAATSSLRPISSLASYVHPKPHPAAFAQRYQTSSSSSSSSSSSASLSTSNPTTASTPTAPQLPARRRPTFAAVGFGNGGSHPEAVRGRARQGASQTGTGSGGGQSSRPPGRDINSPGNRLRASLGVGIGRPSAASRSSLLSESPNSNARPGPAEGLTEAAATGQEGSTSSSSRSILREATDALVRPVASALSVLGSTAGRSDNRTQGSLSSGEQDEIRIRGNEAVELTKEEEGRVDGNEAEACYVPPPATLYYHHPSPLPLLYSSSPLPHFDIAYETWGTLNPTRSNAILLHTGLSASSHVASGGNDVSEETRSKKGWWEDFVGPGKSIDTDRFFVICTNVVGGCFGSTGPSSQWPHGEDGERWATRFPMLSIFDMLRAQLGLLDHLGIDKLYASIGASMGGMQTLALSYLAPERVGRLASISAAGRAGLNGVGMRYAQRSVLMNDPNWNRGFYYDGVPPHTGMKLARQIATITYRSGPEWEERFGRRMLSEREDEQGKKVIGVPSLSPDFLIETYLDHQGERFCLTYDANTMIYLSKAMDLFDMTDDVLAALSEKFATAYPDEPLPFPAPTDLVPGTTSSKSTEKFKFIPTSRSPHLHSLANGLKRLNRIPSLVLGVQSDVLFPVEQQRELADALKLAGNQRVTYYEIGGVWGHDTFLLDVQGVGGAIRGFLEWAD